MKIAINEKRSRKERTATNENRPNMERLKLSEVRELLDYFDGTGETFEKWERQIKFLKHTYHLDDDNMKVLASSRMKGKALDWLHSSADFIEMNFEMLLTAMKSMFDHRLVKITLKKQFEEKKWKREQSFSEYCHAKIILGNKISIAKDELMDYIINGIPDEVLRNQARLHNFDSMSTLLKAFEKVSLRNKMSVKGRVKDNTMTGRVAVEGDRQSVKQDEKKITGRTIRCHNCQCEGHLA